LQGSRLFDQEFTLKSHPYDSPWMPLVTMPMEERE